jgi:hypothetical protein
MAKQTTKTTFGRGIYPNYFFKPADHDPICDFVRWQMQKNGYTPQKLVNERACSAATTRNWGLGRKQDVMVKRPSFTVVASVLLTMGVRNIDLNAILDGTEQVKAKAKQSRKAAIRKINEKTY